MRFCSLIFSLAILLPLLTAFHVPGNPHPRTQRTGLTSTAELRFVLKAADKSSDGTPENDDEDDEGKNKVTEENSAAMKLAAQQQQDLAQRQGEKEAAQEETIGTTTVKKKYVIVGAGWGGWGAAKALCESGIDADITIIDALPDPTGATPYLSKTGKPVEAGTRGFWKDYPNICELLADLGIRENDVFTPFTNSSFYSPDGLEATAPVFSEVKVPKELENVPFLSQFAGQAVPQLPSPFGQVLATFPLFERIPLADRASMVGLLIATIDCLGGDESVQVKYDRMTAHDLFIRFGLSERLVEDFIKPTLLVGLFKPPEELSALVVMELLYYYALAHQDSFDVRWIKNGTVSGSLIAPMAARLQEEYGLKVKGGCRVGKISLEQNASKLWARTIEYSTMDGKSETINDVDGIVMALTCKGMQGVVGASPDLARLPVFSNAASLSGIDVISTRLWLDKTVATRTPANVFSRFEELRGSGGTFFMLDQLQENNSDLWGGEEPQGSVVACDFYNAGALMSLEDKDIVNTLIEDLLPAAVPAFADAKVVDSWVGKYGGTVSWFSPGSYTKRPPLQGAGYNVLPNVKCAGDWVRMGDREHGAKGLCQERAFVSGLEAANALMMDTHNSSFRPHPVIPVREDEAQYKAGVAVNNKVMQIIPRWWVR